MTPLSSLALVGLSISLVAGAPVLAQDAASATSDPAAEPPRCVRLRSINGYSVIDNEHLLLNGGVRRHYLVTTRRPCSQLRYGFQLGTSFGPNERICRPFIEYVTVRGGPRCSIEHIEEVESLKAARALIEARAALEAEQNMEAGNGANSSD